MYPIVNSRPHFCVFDLCKVKETGDIVIIQESLQNSCQTSDVHQWSYSVIPIHKFSKIKSAWYKTDELELVNNVMELIASAMSRDSQAAKTGFDLSRIRRTNETI